MADAVHVRGLADLQRAFVLADREEAKLLRRELLVSAAPVQQLAQGKALGEIRKMTFPWAQMRVGQAKAVVYIVPKRKGTHGRGSGRRPNLKTLLLDRALIPALDARKGEVIERLEQVLATVGDRWEKA